MKTKEQLEAEIAPLQARLAKIREAEDRKEYDALIGRCFKYHNSYGGGRPRWWLYVKVTTRGKYWPKTFEFQTTCDDEIIVKVDRARLSMGGSDYIEISAKEFNAEWRKVQKRVAGMKP